MPQCICEHKHLLRSGKEKNLNLPYILFYLKTFYIFGKGIERNWDCFNENTFINFCCFFLSGVVENSPRSCVELSEAQVFDVMLTEQIAFTP